MALLITTGVLLALVLTFFITLTTKDKRILFAKNQVINVGGNNRSYIISKTNQKPTSMIIALHGLGGQPKTFAYFTGLHNAVDNQTLVVYPQAIKPTKKGVRPGWNSGFCCGSGWVDNIDDVEFLAQLITKLSKEYSISPENTFMSGFSNGAFMTQRFASEKPGLIKAIAIGSGTIGTTKTALQPKTPIPILLMHGKKDKIVLFNGGASSSNPDFEWLSFDQTTEVWQKINGQNTQTKTIIYNEDGHKWHDWRLANFWHKTPQASIEVDTFFKSVQ